MKNIMTKDQQIKKLTATIKEMEAVHKESKERLLELYEEERQLDEDYDGDVENKIEAKRKEIS